MWQQRSIVTVACKPALTMYGDDNNHPLETSPACNHLGFLQKNNNLEEKSRIVSSFKERSSKNLLSCDNSDRDMHFRRTETDFSNLFARGRIVKRGVV